MNTIDVVMRREDGGDVDVRLWNCTDVAMWTRDGQEQKHKNREAARGQ